MRDAILSIMRKLGIPLTRENYIQLAYLGRPQLDAEAEANLPDELHDINDESATDKIQ